MNMFTVLIDLASGIVDWTLRSFHHWLGNRLNAAKQLPAGKPVGLWPGDYEEDEDDQLTAEIEDAAAACRCGAEDWEIVDQPEIKCEIDDMPDWPLAQCDRVCLSCGNVELGYTEYKRQKDREARKDRAMALHAKIAVAAVKAGKLPPPLPDLTGSDEDWDSATNPATAKARVLSQTIYQLAVGQKK